MRVDRERSPHLFRLPVPTRHPSLPLPLDRIRAVHTMKRTASTRTPPSPTTTTYSGISSYQNSTFQPKSPPNQSANYPPLDSLVIAKAHFDELYKYLASYLAKGVCLGLVSRPLLLGVFALATPDSPFSIRAATSLMPGGVRYRSFDSISRRHMAGSVSSASLTPAPSQSLQILEHQHDRSLPASHVSSFRNSQPTCTMNCYEGRIIHQRTKVRQTHSPNMSAAHHLQYAQSLFCPSATISTPNATRPDRNWPRFPPLASRISPATSSTNYLDDIRNSRNKYVHLSRLLLSRSHTTPRLVSKTNLPMNTHPRSTQVHQTLPRYRHSTILDLQKSPSAVTVANRARLASIIRSPLDPKPPHLHAGNHLKTVSIWGVSEASAPTIRLTEGPTAVRIGIFALIGLAGLSASQLRAMGMLRALPVG